MKNVENTMLKKKFLDTSLYNNLHQKLIGSVLIPKSILCPSFMQIHSVVFV